MAKRLNWEKLLSTKRVSDFDTCKLSKQNKSQFSDPRSAFERDYDQLVFSYPFRRLQDKTQVIPFPEFDFVHTRLTHSLEVASVGRSLGKLASKFVFSEISKSFVTENNICPGDIGALVAAACLAHDIGNPPFGHSGEDSISFYFSESGHSIRPMNLISPTFKLTEKKTHFISHEYNFNGDKYEEVEKKYDKQTIYQNTKKWSDLIKFEGNANGFRIITRNCERGINPTAALLGAFSKYPRESFLVKDPFAGIEKSKRPKSQTKYGFFQEQRNLFNDIATHLGLIKVSGIDENDIAFKRHPLTFLVEAADDISYQIIDFEDGCRLNLIDFDKEYILETKTKRNIKKSPKDILIGIASIDKSFDKSKLENMSDFKEAISYLRSKVINVLVHTVFDVFAKNYEAIMLGEFDNALIECIDNKSISDNLRLMKELVKKQVYNYKPVLESEASGFEVMSALIESFAVTTNICISCGDKETPKQKKLKSLLPKEYQPKDEKEDGNLSFDEVYERVLKILDYVSGMTDNYAISLYRRIKGISLPTR